MSDLRADDAAAFAGMRATYALAAQERTPVVRRLRLAGLGIELRIAGETLARRLDPALAHRSQPEGTHQEGARLDGDPDVVVHLWDAAETATPLPAFPDAALDGGVTGESRVAHAGDVRVRYQPDLRVLCAYDRTAGEAYYCAADATELPWWEDAAPMRTLLSWILADRGRVLLHGAAVGGPAGAVLLVGRGGSGKSSTSLACLAAGMGFLGDDYCVLEPGDPPRVHSLYGSAKVHADQLGWYPDLQAHVVNVEREPDDKVVLLPSRWAPDAVVDTAVVVAVVAPVLGGGTDSRLEPMSRAAALAALAPSSILQLPGAARVELAAMAVLLRQVPCWRLTLGSDRAGVVAPLRELLEHAAEGRAAS